MGDPLAIVEAEISKSNDLYNLYKVVQRVKRVKGVIIKGKPFWECRRCDRLSRFPSARPSPGSVTGLACEISCLSHVDIHLPANFTSYSYLGNLRFILHRQKMGLWILITLGYSFMFRLIHRRLDLGV
jgi:hypothetical protein